MILAGWLGLQEPAWAGATNAEDPVINAQAFRPSLDAERTIWTDDTHLGSPGFFLRAPISWTENPLVYTYDDGQDVGLVSEVLAVDLMPGVHVGRLRVGLDLPMFAMVQTRDYAGPSWGDLRVDGRFVLLEGSIAPIGIAVDGGVGLPTGLTTMLRAAETTWDLALVIDKDVGPSRVGLNVGHRGGPDRHLENIHLDDALTVRIAYSHAFHGFGLDVEAIGLVPYLDPMGLSAEWMAGGWWRRGDIVLRAGAGTGITGGIGSPDARVVFAIGFERPDGPLDRDGDGIPNREDACPRDPEDKEGADHQDGCAELRPVDVLTDRWPD